MPTYLIWRVQSHRWYFLRRSNKSNTFRSLTGRWLDTLENVVVFKACFVIVWSKVVQILIITQVLTFSFGYTTWGLRVKRERQALFVSMPAIWAVWEICLATRLLVFSIQALTWMIGSFIKQFTFHAWLVDFRTESILFVHFFLSLIKGFTS